MVVFNSLQPEKAFEISEKNEILLSRLKHLFNHHSFLNYLVVHSEDDEHLLRYSTLNQPYTDPEFLSLIVKPKRFKINAVDHILKTGSATINHLPITRRDIHRAYRIPDIQSFPKFSETDFTKEFYREDFSTPCIAEASIKMGLTYDSHVTIVPEEMVLLKFRIAFLAYDQIGHNRLTSPMLSIVDAIQPMDFKVERTTRKAM
ncbi:hypothetical protein [Luteibaculum oceani]|uniref:Uncharacterized protein n=1 Tax=Luteibaculum oceani TaxID=1294296 RepID=A0A5C6V968_9FLAO|nr:hypothetical protein [Luteibaculum oceani]TXC81699.1 hypothetical protein FRX97_04060 [Luteibaculum oceani]